MPSDRIPTAYYAKGNYFTLAGRSPFSRLIYPVPVPGGLGVHITVDLGGQAKFGPDVEWIPGIDYTVDPHRADKFYAAVRKYWPALKDGALQPGYAGIRPKIVPPGAPAQDFTIQGPAEHGVPGLINLFGIESPGLTASLALAEKVRALAGRHERWRAAASSASLATLLGGCSPAALLNATVPSRGYTLETDIAYGPLPRQKLDLYTPETAARRRQVGDLLLWRLVGQRRQGRLPVRRPGAGLARHHHHHPRLSPLSRGALPGLPRGCRAGDALGGRSRRPRRSSSSWAIRPAPISR